MSDFGVVPDGWKVRRLGDLLSIQYGKSPKAILSATGCYPIWGTGGVTGKTYEYLHEGDSIVIGRKGTIDKPQFVTGKFWVIDTAYYASNFNGCLPKWLYYSILNLGIKKYNESTGVPSLNRETIYSISSLHPPLQEQKKIAEILTAVDAVIEKTEAQISKLRDLKKAMMTELLTKGIGHTEFKDSSVGRIPAEWEVKAVRSVVKNIKSGLSRRIVQQDIGIPMLTSGNIQDNKLDVSGLKYWYAEDPQGACIDNYLLLDDDILICFINSMSQIGKSCIYKDIGRPAIYTTNMFRVQVNEEASSEFIYRVFTTERFQTEIQLITKPAINQASFTKADFEELLIPIPPKKEQEKIVSAMNSIDSNMKSKQQKLNQTKTLKKALMHDLLTGKKRVKVAAD